ncbi:hypothetical protein RSOL_499290 [Rhizoctonia solani AG-3 Rhs1AP]|uniref:DinB-like domain-containing protein n=1 Tax=Rhizoctonia solani AG-3 Rhs1AP TaxID=1086054 RepID=X8JTP9_9AGAM|nr:hypothetical protein RSOL_499290 [Rhizoctonia solani AG-3 Rhs1AP]
MAPIAIMHSESVVASNKATRLQDHSIMVEQLTSVARDVMSQAIDLLQNTLTDDKQLTYQSKYIPGSTIGKHLRHARDPYVLLSKVTPATLTYDIRIRDTSMETSIAAGIEAFREAIKQLEDISKYTPEDLPVVLTADTGPCRQTLNTTYGRELWFGSLHAIHHWSMIRVVAGELGLKMDANFGIAPATINYHKSEGSKSKI